MNRIPKRNQDLRRRVLRQELLRLLAYLLWIAAWLAGALFYNQSNRHLDVEHHILGWKLAFWMAGAVLIGAILFRIWRVFTERSCRGTILRAGLSRSYDASRDPGLGKAADYDFRLNTYLKVRRTNGRIARLRFEQKPGFYLYYGEGEHILRFRGLPYPLNLDPSARHGYLCVACGEISPTAFDVCEKCGLTRIRVEDIIAE